MANDMNEDQIIMSAKQTATILGIQNSTLRKYAQLLEKSGYHIHKNEHGHRGFFNKDIIVLQKIIQLAKNPDTSLDSAINIVLSTLGTTDVADSDTQEIVESPYITKDEFEEYQRKQAEMQKALFEKQSALIKDLVGRLEQQEKFTKRIEEKEKEHDLLKAQIEEQAKSEVAASFQKKPWWKLW
jgi:biotin operon repressor